MTGLGAFGAWSRWRLDRRGVAAVEFALILPFLLILFLGGYQITQAVSAYRKLTDTTTQLGNVVAQYTTMSDTDYANVYGATSQIMSPYSTSNLKVVVSEISTNAANTPTVVWSRPYNGGTALTCGATVTMPTGLATPSSHFIFVQTAYTWVPPFTSSFTSNVPMNDTLYIIPRNSALIATTATAAASGGCPS